MDLCLHFVYTYFLLKVVSIYPNWKAPKRGALILQSLSIWAFPWASLGLLGFLKLVGAELGLVCLICIFDNILSASLPVCVFFHTKTRERETFKY